MKNLLKHAIFLTLIFSNLKSNGQCAPKVILEIDRPITDSIVVKYGQPISGEAIAKFTVRITLDSLCKIGILNVNNGNIGQQIQKKKNGKYQLYETCEGGLLWDLPWEGMKTMYVSNIQLSRIENFPSPCTTFETGDYRTQISFWYEQDGKLQKINFGWFYYNVKVLR